MNKKYEIDMCSGSVLGKMLLFALPLMCSSILQLLFNAADIVVVGRFAGDNALAAVGSNTALINLITNVFVGLSVGTNVLTAQYYGAKNDSDLKTDSTYFNAVKPVLWFAAHCDWAGWRTRDFEINAGTPRSDWSCSIIFENLFSWNGVHDDLQFRKCNSKSDWRHKAAIVLSVECGDCERAVKSVFCDCMSFGSGRCRAGDSNLADDLRISCSALSYERAEQHSS